jgi:prophage regulatory protein
VLLSEGLGFSAPVTFADRTPPLARAPSAVAVQFNQIFEDGLLVPLSDTTIYEMEQRGEFPKRFYLTPRCAAWDLGEVQGWIELRRRASASQAIKPAPHPDVGLRKSRPVRRQRPRR